MKEEYLKYGKRLDTIGELIITISNMIGTDKTEKWSVTIERYNYALDSLSDVKAPTIIKNEHSQLLEALNDWIGATEELIIVRNQSEYELVAKRQKEHEREIESITRIIGDKLISSLK